MGCHIPPSLDKGQLTSQEARLGRGYAKEKARVKHSDHPNTGTTKAQRRRKDKNGEGSSNHRKLKQGDLKAIEIMGAIQGRWSADDGN